MNNKTIKIFLKIAPFRNLKTQLQTSAVKAPVERPSGQGAAEVHFNRRKNLCLRHLCEFHSPSVKQRY
jgi:hypothetical protein